MDPDTRTKGAGRRRRGPRPATADALEKAALHYLGRYASSSANLRHVLMRKVTRAARAHGGDPAQGARLVDAIVARYLAAGLLDDAAYAAERAASLRRRGTSRHAIRGRLALKGVDSALIAATLARLDEEAGESELAAAAALARRRRLGPYRAKAARAAFRQKDMAALARAGFGLGLARRVLAAADPEVLEALVRVADDEA
jgi:regulatory protein